ncbi:MAG: cytidine deaminase [Planctomycetota bacterium]
MAQLSTLVPRWKELRDASRHVRGNAWAPYSKYQVGAAVLTSCGRIFTGCNVENASYGLTICAERVAISSAVAQGFTKFDAVSVSLSGIPVPCGACRQFLYEFSPEMIVVLDDIHSGSGMEPEFLKLSELLPRAFRLENDMS